jgi:peroxiredoxin Q/BCP
MSELTEGHRVGQKAPDFTLQDGNGQAWKLSAQRGKVVAMLFYPGDETPVCTKQLCSARDRWQDYLDTGAEIVGISTDTSESHKKFAEHHDLPMPLLADVDAHVAGLYKMLSIVPGQAARGVIIVDGEGVIRYRYLRAIMGMIFPPKDDETIAAIKAVQRGETPA